MPGRSEAPAPAGVILAGGASRRMGAEKAFAELAGQPLIRHVIDRMQPQVSALALAVERPSPSLTALGLPLLEDPRPGHQGPLGGLLSALRHFGATAPWVLLAPCDSPFLPRRVASRLLACAEAAGCRAASVVLDGMLQPQHSLWHRDLLPLVERAVLEQGQGGLRAVLQAAGFAGCDWRDEPVAGEPPPFFNVNDPPALAQARRWLETSGWGMESC